MILSKRFFLGLVATAATIVPTVTFVAGAHAVPRVPSITACSKIVDDKWPAPVAGEPTGFKAGLPSGAYYWHDDTGWHLRVTHDTTKLQTFSGSIKLAAGLFHFDKVLSPARDKVAFSKDGRTMLFTLRNFGKLDGFDFRTACASRLLTSIRVGKVQLGRKQVFIGTKAWHPSKNPFRFATR